MSSRNKDDMRGIERKLQDLQSDIARLPVRLAKASPTIRGKVIWALVDETGGVTAGDPTFAFKDAERIVGDPPADGTGTAQNQYGQEYNFEDPVLLFYNDETEQWLTERGGSAGSTLVYFELVQDKVYADYAKLALTVNELGVMVGDPEDDSFYVIDEEEQFWGLAGVDLESGYRGYAVRVMDAYDGADGERPAYRIINMEAPAHWIIVELNEAFSMGGTECTIQTNEIWGRAWRNKKEPPSGTVDVFDDENVAQNAAEGERWLCAWDEEDEHYIFILKLGGFFTGLYLTYEEISAASYAAGTLTAGNGLAQKFISQNDGTWDLDTEEEYVLYNSVASPVPINKIVQVKVIDGYPFIDVEDCTE